MIWDITDLNNVKNLVFERDGNNLFFVDEVDSLKITWPYLGIRFHIPHSLKG